MMRKKLTFIAAILAVGTFVPAQVLNAWPCGVCTFENTEARSICEMCSAKKNLKVGQEQEAVDLDLAAVLATSLADSQKVYQPVLGSLTSELGSKQKYAVEHLRALSQSGNLQCALYAMYHAVCLLGDKPVDKHEFDAMCKEVFENFQLEELDKQTMVNIINKIEFFTPLRKCLDFCILDNWRILASNEDGLRQAFKSDIEELEGRKKAFCAGSSKQANSGLQ